MNVHVVVGTAGHVDHGKTLLTAALTHVDTDRLPEEKRRGMTIVPGYVALDLPEGIRLGLVDVPGHEKFVKNMLAGVGGIDMALLVVAADEGVMPQTVEHLNILHLLGIEKGVVAITKCDLVDGDEEWLALVHEQVRELLSGTLLHDAPLIDVSAVSGYHIEELKSLLGQVAASVRERPPVGFSRMPVDRCFIKQGFGTVVTGTMWAGAVSVGQRLELHPQGTELRVRGLQVHGQAVERAQAGQRTAINLAGPGAENAEPGCWLAEPGLLRASYRLDVKLDLLKNAGELKHRARVHLFHGTSQVSARVRLLDRETLRPGMSCLCQLELEQPLPPLRGDRLILRSWSPEITIAGATVLDTAPPRYRLSDPATMEILGRKSGQDHTQAVLDILDREAKLLNLQTVSSLAQLPAPDVQTALARLIEARRALSFGGDPEQYLSAELYERWRAAMRDTLELYHRQHPLRRGMPVAELRQRVFGRIQTRQLSLLLAAYEADGDIRLEESLVAAGSFQRYLTAEQKKTADRILALYTRDVFNPPAWQDAMSQLSIPEDAGQEYLGYLLDRASLLRIGEIFFHKSVLAKAEKCLRDHAESFTVSQAREILGTSRKYVVPLLERMDDLGITTRSGDKRSFSGKAE